MNPVRQEEVGQVTACERSALQLTLVLGIGPLYLIAAHCRASAVKAFFDGCTKREVEGNEINGFTTRSWVVARYLTLDPEDGFQYDTAVRAIICIFRPTHIYYFQ